MNGFRKVSFFFSSLLPLPSQAGAGPSDPETLAGAGPAKPTGLPPQRGLTPQPSLMCAFPVAAVTEGHLLRGFTQHAFALSQFCGSEVPRGPPRLRSRGQKGRPAS